MNKASILFILTILVFFPVSCSDPSYMYQVSEGTLSLNVHADAGKTTEMAGMSPDTDDITWTYLIVPADNGIGVGKIPVETKMPGSDVTLSVSHGNWKVEVWGYRDESCREPVYHGSGICMVGRNDGYISVSAFTITDAGVPHAMNSSETPKTTADLLLAPISLQGDDTGTVMRTAEWTLDSDTIATWTAEEGIWHDYSTGKEILPEGVIIEVPCGTGKSMTLTIMDEEGNILAREGWNNLTFAMNCIYKINGKADVRMGEVTVNINVNGIPTDSRASVKCGSYIDSFFSINPSSEMPADDVAVIGYRIRGQGDPAYVCSSDLTEALTYPCKLYIPGVPDKDMYVPSELGLTVIYADSAEVMAASGAENAWVGKNVTFLGNLTDPDQSSLKSAGLVSDAVSVSASMFNGNSTMEDVIIPEGILTINDSAFKNCTALRKVTVPSSVIRMKTFIFSGCTSLEEAVLREGVKTVPFYCFNNCTALRSVHLPETIEIISQSAFQGCSSLLSISIPASVTEIRSSAFNECTNLETVLIPENSGLITIDNYCFQSCKALKSITLPNTVTTFGQEVFSGCTSLEYMTIPYGITSLPWYLFNGCSSLRTVTIPETVMELKQGVFNGCSALNEIRIDQEEGSLDLSIAMIPDTCTVLWRGQY